VLVGGAAVVVPVLLFLTASVYGALRTPGNEGVQAKWADWMRNHHAAVAVNWVEQKYYAHQAPPVGGRPDGLNPVARASGSIAGNGQPALPAPPAIRPLVGGLAGEGAWLPTGPLVQGKPGMYVAQVRPDQVHTSVLTSVVWADPGVFRFGIVPGAREPGGTWKQPPAITGSQLTSVVAAFNGGFRFKDAHGGFASEGRVEVPLVDGAASLVVFKDGRATVGQWGRDVRSSDQPASVLQNLVLLVDHGRPVADIDANDTSRWGQTLGNKTLVWRSGVGVTRNGALVYAAGPGLTAKTLADVLTRAGAERAMTLDINPEWVTFNFFDHPDPKNPQTVVGRKLADGMHRSANRYLSTESRDFVTISMR
ncbi:MAG: hypothetical protein JWM05_3311, partial [Acidimicrobiales bacterium]|nr:hypothetical protein [Acidimicrobiales bacterium]